MLDISKQIDKQVFGYIEEHQALCERLRDLQRESRGLHQGGAQIIRTNSNKPGGTTCDSSEGLHAELAKEGIHVLTVVPGLMRTGSPPNAFFKGQHRIEYALFNLLDTLPFTSISARKAAKQIVHATKRGDAEIILSIQAQLAVRFHGLFPGVTVDMLGLVNRLLPGIESDATAKERWMGKESTTALSSSFLTILGEKAANEKNKKQET